MAYSLTFLQEKIGYTFNDKNILQQALVHPSSSNGITQRQGTHTFQRLEFLGDRVLGLTISHWIYFEFPRDPEGELSLRYDGLVGREALRKVADKIELRKYLFSVQDNTGRFAEESILADCCEALICALYLDGGIAESEKFIKRFWKDFLDAVVVPAPDPKSGLQQWAHWHRKPKPEYTLVSMNGPDHAPIFKVQVDVDGLPSFQGTGSSKKDAEQAAAKKALEYPKCLLERMNHGRCDCNSIG